MLLVSVPYALKAADAETFGGKPLSAFVLAEPGPGPAREVAASRQVTALALVATAPASERVLVTSGTPGYLGKFTNSTDLGNSVLFETGGRAAMDRYQVHPHHVPVVERARQLCESILAVDCRGLRTVGRSLRT